MNQNVSRKDRQDSQRQKRNGISPGHPRRNWSGLL